VETFLKKSKIKYKPVTHKTVFTAYDKAATLRAKPATIAKVLVVKVNGELAMAVVGGDKNLDIEKLQKLTKAKKVDFAKEKTIGEIFKGIDPGAVPPFSGLWKTKVFYDKKLLEQPKIILSAGSYETSLEMTPSSLKKASAVLAVGNFSKPKEKPKAKKKPAKSLKKKK
jgi:Ala-tRNA(Pro) deacylase